MGAMETVEEEEIPEPLDLNSFEFFVQALSYFEGKANGKLSSSEQSPATPVGSSSSRLEINAIKTAILQETSDDESKLLDEVTSTPETSSDLSLEEMLHDDSLTNMMVNLINVDNNIVGTIISLTNVIQMSDPNLKRLRTIIESQERSQEKSKINKKDLENNIQKRLLKNLPKFKIIKNLIFFVDEYKFKN